MNDLISILMPVYNCGNYIATTINSILKQTYSNWELIIIDDCSTDNTIEIISNFNDIRIKTHKNEVNLGLAASLNKCINFSKGQFIARMDGDDIMLPNRLEIQINFLKKNLDVDVIGGSAYLIDEYGNIIGIKESLNPKNYNNLLLNQGIFIHPTVMGKAGWFKSNLYNPVVLRGQDLELWIRTFNYSKFVNLDDFLICYREVGKEYKVKYEKIFFALKIILSIHKKSIPFYLRRYLLFRAYFKFRFFNILFWLGLIMPEHRKSAKSNTKYIINKLKF